MRIVIDCDPEKFDMGTTFAIESKNEDDRTMAVSAIMALVDVIAQIDDDPMLKEILITDIIRRFAEKNEEEVSNGQI